MGEVTIINDQGCRTFIDDQEVVQVFDGDGAKPFESHYQAIAASESLIQILDDSNFAMSGTYQKDSLDAFKRAMRLKDTALILAAVENLRYVVKAHWPLYTNDARLCAGAAHRDWRTIVHGF